MAYNFEKGNSNVTVQKGNRIPPVMNAAQLVNGAMKQSTDKQRKIKGKQAKNNHVPPNTGKMAGAALRRLSKMGHTGDSRF